MHCPIYMCNKQSWEPADHVTKSWHNCGIICLCTFHSDIPRSRTFQSKGDLLINQSQVPYHCKIRVENGFLKDEKGEFHPIWNLHRVLPTHRIL